MKLSSLLAVARHGAALRGIAALLLLTACGSAGTPPVRSTVHVEPAPRTTVDENAPLPALPVAQLGEGAGRRVQMEVVDQDLRLVVRSLAESFGLDYQLDPAVSGRVTTRLSGATLTEALDALVLPSGYQYQIQGNVLRVTPTRLQTRMFSLDYVSLSRFGVGTTVVQRRLGAGGGGFGAGVAGAAIGGAAGGGGGDLIQRVTVADLWQEIRVALEGLIFDFAVAGAPAAGGAVPAAAAGAGETAAGSGAAPYSRVGPEGRRLIINPMAGIITVSASPEKLAEVDAYLKTIENSVQRQVLIEAKIVEILLDRSFQFGIDWSALRQLGGLSLQIGGGAGGAQFTLGTRSGDANGSINLVLDALDEQGEVNVLSNPRVSVLNNQPAVFGVTTEQVFFSVTRQPILGPTGGTIGFNTEVVPQQISVGITLDVVAQISANDVITMNVRPVITDVISEKSIQLPDGTQSTAPVIDRRETDTMVRVRGGETIVIGGLMQTRRSSRQTGIPGLRNIPGIGAIFGGTSREMEKRELVIFITPRVIAGQLATAD